MKLGIIQTELRVAKGGYTPGEAIRVSLNIKNGSRRSVRNVAICLCQIVNYRGTEFHWQDKPILVPSIPPRMVTKCKLIDVSYCLELQFNNSPKFTISLPIVIGTIPILPGILKNTKNNNNGIIQQQNKDFVQVTVTDETGKILGKNGKTEENVENDEEDRMDPETEQLRKEVAKKRVRMPSSVLSELYPALASPYYKEFYLGPVPISDDKERKFHFGKNRYAPKYPFYE
uniref:Arrestin C-terminal-like domain-containing protein n=1 Tax=Meloidogyne floridensis TaxID=298350 RepID=A0A915P2H8_9BILA